jgi:hypothetical protein
MNKIWTLVAFSALVVSQTVDALPEEHEARRLMLAAEEAVTGENWVDAGEYLNRLQALEADKPVAYQYYRGRVMFEAGHQSEAMAALEAYVTAAGEEGTHYQETLKLITRIEAQRKEQSEAAQDSAGKSEPVATIESAGSNSIQQLQQLYLASSPREALASHANSLLTLNAWQTEGERRVARANVEPTLLYQVSATSDGQLQVQETRRAGDSASAQSATGPEKAAKVTSNFPVYGVNPQVEWDCVEAGSACWIYDPRDGSRWIKLGNNSDQTEQVAQTLGDLIRHLQSP